MSTRNSSRPILPLILAAALGALALAPSEVLADRGRVHLNDGSVIRGEIVAYDPGAGVTIQMESGSTIELAADDVARVDIGSDAVEPVPAPTTAIEAPAPPPDTTLRPAMSRATSSRPGLVGPILTGSIGALLVVTGAPLFATGYACYECYEFTSRQIAGLSVMGVGGALFVSGFGIWMARRVKARRAWDREHVSLRLAPTLGRSHAGLQLTGTF